MKLILTTVVWSSIAQSAFSQTAAEWLKRAEVFESQGQTQQATDAYLTADKLQPNRADILVKIAKQYGDLMTQEKDPSKRKILGEQSLAASRQALRADSKNSDAHLSVAISLGKLVEFMGNREKIENSHEIQQEAERALKLDPKSDYAHHMLGRWHQELASMGSATRALAQVIYGSLPAASYAEALEHFRKAREIRPERLIHQIEYGRTLAMIGRSQDAKKEINKGLAMPNRDKDDEQTKQRGRETLKDL